MPRPAVGIAPLPHPFQNSIRILATPAEDHKIVRVTHHREASIRHQVIQRIQIDVRQ